MKNVYLIVTDLHLDFSKANRLNYFGEILNAMQDIMNIAKKYKDQGYNVYQCLLGDVFDGSFSNPSEAMQAIEIFRYYCNVFNSTWSVVGNHEITYAKDNPFWFLVSEITDVALLGVRRFLQPRGLQPTISVVDKFEDGEVSFYFNHFGTSAKVPDAIGVRIGLFHQNVGSNEICKMWGTFDNVEEASYIQGYNYCFFGHMHLAKGKYILNEAETCRGEWLGTIGRTKVDEIIDDSLDVNIPAIKVEDGKFQGIDDNSITLLNSKECIDYVKLTAYKKSRKVIEEREKNTPNKYKGVSLFDTLQGSFVDTGNGFLLDFLDRSWDEILYSYNQTLRNPVSSVEGD